MTVSIVKGVTPDGRVVTLRLNEDGSLAIGGVSTGGGGGDMTIGGATAANQDEQTALLEQLRDRVTTLNSYIDGLEGYIDEIESNQQREIARLIEIRDRFPISLENDRLAVNSLTVARPVTPILLSINIAVANQEYSQAIANAKKFSFQVLSGGDIRYAYQASRVATPTLPYYPLLVGSEESEDFCSTGIFSGTLYLASSIAGTIVILKVWS